MFLQILPPNNVIASKSTLDNQLLFVVLGLAIGVFVILRIAKLLSKIKVAKSPKNPAYTS